MLGYVVLKAKEDFYRKESDSVFIYKKDHIYVGRFYHSEVMIYDERDNAIKLGYYHNCFRMVPHCTMFFDVLEQKEAVNGKEFYNIRKELRKVDQKVIVDERIFEERKVIAKPGDFLVSDGFIFMIVKDDTDKTFRLLRIKDGSGRHREGFEYSIVNNHYNTIDELMSDSDISEYRLVPNNLLKLTIVD